MDRVRASLDNKRATSFRPRAEIPLKAVQANPDPSLPTAAAARHAHADGYCKNAPRSPGAHARKPQAETLKIKTRPDVGKPHLIRAYPYPHGDAFHVGHNFKLLYEFRNEPQEQNATKEKNEPQ